MATFIGGGDATIEVDVGTAAITAALAAKSVAAHDAIEFSYEGNNVKTVVFKNSGSAVATLTLTYSGNKISSVAWT